MVSFFGGKGRNGEIAADDGKENPAQVLSRDQRSGAVIRGGPDIQGVYQTAQVLRSFLSVN